MTTLPMESLMVARPRSESTESGEVVHVEFSASTTDVDTAPSFAQLLAYVLDRLRGDPTNRELFVDDLLEADSSDAVEWVVEQWIETIELEENEPDLVVDLLDRLRNREG